MYCNLQYIRAPHSTMYCNLQYILDLEIGRSFLLIGLFSSRNFAIHSPELKVSIWSEKWGATANSPILKLSIWNSPAVPAVPAVWRFRRIADTARRTEPGNRAHAFRMTLVAQGKLLQTND